LHTGKKKSHKPTLKRLSILLQYPKKYESTYKVNFRKS